MTRARQIAFLAATLLVGAIASAQAPTTPAVTPATPPAAPQLEPRTVPEVPRLGRVSLIEVHETVDPGIAAFIQRVLKEHKEDEIVLLDINTLGGRLDSALAIRDALLDAEPRTICWVRPRAISAGALITLACDVVVVADGASIGAATPVLLGLSGDTEPADEKTVSYMRQEMANTAKMQKRNPLIAEAMVDPDVEIQGLVELGKLLTLSSEQALEWGIADLRASDEASLWRAVDRDPPKVQRLEPTGAEKFARVIADPTVALVLLMLGLLGIGIELFHPSNGSGLLFGLLCLGTFFFGHHAVHLAGWGELALVLVGIGFIAIESFLPGNTIFGVLGLHFVLVGLFMALVSLEHLPIDVAWSEGLLPRALSTVFGAFLLTALAAGLLVKYAPSSRYAKSLVLNAVVPEPNSEVKGIGLQALVGAPGVALTDLRPVGRIEVLNKRLEARMERGFVQAGAKIQVTRVDGNVVFVREPITPAAEPEAVS